MRLAIVAHDAGGAEILSSYVRQQRPDCLYVLGGPACQIFERKLGHIAMHSLEDALAQADSLLCGTSWQSDLEIGAIKLARSLGKRSVAAIDHWVNYRERFTRNDELCLPDEIWTFDPEAESMATQIFCNTVVRRLQNPYLTDLEHELAGVPSRIRRAGQGMAVLYVCEPVREHALRIYGNERHWGYVEEEALRYFLSNVDALGGDIEGIVVRPHPSESAQKYLATIAEFQLPVSVGGGRSLIEEIVESDVVVGCHSMAMVVGLLARKRVVSCIPPGGIECRLPHREIQILQVLLSNQSAAVTS